MEFIKAQEKDLDLVYNIVRESVVDTFSKRYGKAVVDLFLEIHSKEAILNDIINYDMYMIKDNGNFVGTGFARENHICRVYMLPKCQGKGYGTGIMDFLENIISQKYDTAVLDPTEMAIPFYEKRGYAIIDHKEHILEDGTRFAHDIMEKRFRQK